MLFSCIANGVRQRFIDVSHQATDYRHMPVSLGFRTQALKLRFVSPETKGRFLRPQQSFENVMQVFLDRFKTLLPKPIFDQAHIGENLSLIYSPFYADGKIYDGVLNEPITSDLPDDYEDMLRSGQPSDWAVQFLPALCPSCGWDLEGKRDALVLLCRNCNSAWAPGKDQLVKIKFAHIAQADDNVLYLPFWRIKTNITGIELESYADLVKLANLPKIIKKQWHDVPFCFWSPAFKIRPQTFLPLVSKMTLTQPQEKLVYEPPKAGLYPVNLPVEEAVESLKICLASFMKPQSTLFPKLSEIKIKAKSYLLVYVPFLEKYHELIQPSCNFTITKAHLTLAKNL